MVILETIILTTVAKVVQDLKVADEIEKRIIRPVDEGLDSEDEFDHMRWLKKLVNRDAQTRLETAEKLVRKNRGRSKTFTEPIPDDDDAEVKRFKENFYRVYLYCEEKEMMNELKRYPETLGEHYRILVPSLVSHEEFFCRYYYRCKIEHVLKQLERQEAAAAVELHEKLEASRRKASLRSDKVHEDANNCEEEDDSVSSLEQYNIFRQYSEEIIAKIKESGLTEYLDKIDDSMAEFAEKLEESEIINYLEKLGMKSTTEDDQEEIDFHVADDEIDPNSFELVDVNNFRKQHDHSIIEESNSDLQ